MERILEVQKLCKRIDGTEILRDVSFSLERGETLAVIGASGSGKTTLLRCLNLLTLPESGRILLRGETLFDGALQRTEKERRLRDLRLHFGLVFQGFQLFPQYTALENVMLAPLLRRGKSARRALEQEAGELLERVGLGDRGSLYPHQMSGGQQQRVAIARALALRPDVLCLDEPTSALDPELTAGVLRVIRELAHEYTTMIVVTHEMNFARAAADRVVFMDGGTVAEQGTAEQIFGSPRLERTKKFLHCDMKNF